MQSMDIDMHSHAEHGSEWKSLNNIYTFNTFTFINKQDIMTDYFKRVA